MTELLAEPRPRFLDGPLHLYIGGEFIDTEDRITVLLNPATGKSLEALEPDLQSRSICLDLEAAMPQSGQAISRTREGQP